MSALACALEQIRNGVTTIADPGGQHVDGAGRALERAGIRGFLGRSTMDEPEGVPESRRESTEETLAVQDELAERWDGAADGRLRFSYTLRTIFNCSDELIEASVERARKLGTPLQMHIAEIPAENEHTNATRGTTTVRHLANLGALGPWFLGAHAVWLEDEEIALLAETGAAVSHNLASNLRVLGLPRVADMLDAGVLVGLGTDGAPANNRMSLIDELWAATLLQKGLRLDPTVLDARTAFAMATRDGARALGIGDEIGSLEPGEGGRSRARRSADGEHDSGARRGVRARHGDEVREREFGHVRRPLAPRRGRDHRRRRGRDAGRGPGAGGSRRTPRRSALVAAFFGL